MERVRSRRPGRGIPPAPPAIGVRRGGLAAAAGGSVFCGRRSTEEPRGGAFRGRRIGLSPGHLFRGVWRTFRARPLLVASCVAILAAGIGSATAVAAATALLVRPLPLPHSVGSFPVTPCARASIHSARRCSGADAFKSRVASFERMVSPGGRSSTLRAGGGRARRRRCPLTTWRPPWRRHTGGRSPGRSAGQCRRCCDQPLVVDPAVRRRPDTVGRSLTIDGRSATVVGIFPPGFDLPSRPRSGCRCRWRSIPCRCRIGSASAYMPLARLRPGARSTAPTRRSQRSSRHWPMNTPSSGAGRARDWPAQQLLGDLDGRTTNRRARARGGGLPAGDLLCERREPAAPACGGPRARSGHSRGAGGVGRSARAGTALRITGYRPDGRRRRPGPHRLAGAVAGCDESDPPLGAGARADRCSRRRSHDRDRCRYLGVDDNPGRHRLTPESPWNGHVGRWRHRARVPASAAHNGHDSACSLRRRLP